MNWGQWFMIGLSIVLFVWFIVGVIVNRRRGGTVYDWLVKGLPSPPDRVQWNGVLRSAAYLHWERPLEPFLKLAVLLTLTPRENLPLWLFRRLQGRRDELYLRADLRAVPTQEVEVGLRGDRSFETYLARQLKEPYATLPATGKLEIARRGKQDTAGLERLKVFLSGHERAVLRLSLRRKSPHLFLQLRLPPLQAESANQFFDALRALLQ